MAGKKYLGSVIPFVFDIAKAMCTETKAEAIGMLTGGDEIIEGYGNNIPGAIKLSAEDVEKLGFKVNFYLKQNSNLCPDDLDNSVVMIASIQHKDAYGCLVADGLTRQLDPITEIQTSTIITKIVAEEIPGAYGNNYDMSKLMEGSSTRVDDIIKQKIEDKKIRDEKIAKYEANPELAQKHTKKAIENLRLKHQIFLKKEMKTQEDVNDFNQHLLRLMENILEINNLKSFKDLREVPVIKEELDKGGNLGDILAKLSTMEDAFNKSREQKNLVPETIGEEITK